MRKTKLLLCEIADLCRKILRNQEVQKENFRQSIQNRAGSHKSTMASRGRGDHTFCLHHTLQAKVDKELMTKRISLLT